jgi:hypothetical protein
MRAVSRRTFLVIGNACWLAQSAIEVFAPQLRSFLTWRRVAFKPELQIGCFRDSYFDSLPDRLYVVGLVWLLTAPLMTAIAWKLPRDWPTAIRHPYWSPPAASLSWAALLGIAVLLSWPLVAALRAPVSSIAALEAVRAAIIAAPALYYRAILLSAEPSQRFT